MLVKDSSLLNIVYCTQKRLSYRMPPYNVLNSNAYIVDADIPGWVFILDSHILQKTEVTIYVEMDSSGNLFGTARIWDIGFAKRVPWKHLIRK